MLGDPDRAMRHGPFTNEVGKPPSNYFWDLIRKDDTQTITTMASIQTKKPYLDIKKIKLCGEKSNLRRRI